MKASVSINSFEPMYESSSEKELVKLWDDIKVNDLKSINRNLNKRLMKVISEKEEIEIKYEDPALYSNQMYDIEKKSWVPFDLFTAKFMINHRKEYVLLRMYRPCDMQPEFGPLVKGWYSYDSRYLNDHLREDKKFDLYVSKSAKDFMEEIRQEREQEQNPY